MCSSLCHQIPRQHPLPNPKSKKCVLAALLLPHLTAGAAITLFQGRHFGSSYRGKAQVKQISLRVAQFLPSVPVSHDTKPACKIQGSWNHSQILIFSFTLVLFLLWQVQTCFVKIFRTIIWQVGHFSFFFFDQTVVHTSSREDSSTCTDFKMQHNDRMVVLPFL